jgi:hypothetical protein
MASDVVSVSRSNNCDIAENLVMLEVPRCIVVEYYSSGDRKFKNGCGLSMERMFD